MPKRKQAEAGEADGPMAEGQVVPIRRSSRQQAKVGPERRQPVHCTSDGT